MKRITKEQEKQLKYKDRLAKIERYIDILEENDINMKSQREYLKKILTEEESKTNDVLLNELGTLIESLKEYADIVNIIDTIEDLKTQQSPAQRKQLIFDIIEILKENTSEEKIPKKVLKKALNAIYQNIKSELENFLESETLSYIGTNLYIEQINEIIKEDIKEIKTSTFVNNPEMLEVLDQEIEKNKENLLNKQLLITIIACRKKEELRSRTILYMMNEDAKLNRNIEIIHEKHEKSIEIIQLIKDILKKYQKDKQKIKVNIPALVLTGTLLTGAALSVPTISNKKASKKVYPTITKHYRLERAIYEEEQEEKYEELINEEGKQITLTVQSEPIKINHNHYHRNETTYDITNATVEKEDPYYYINLDLEESDQIKEITSNKIEITKDEYEGEVRLLTITTQDLTKEKEEFNSQEYLELRNGLYIMIILASLIPNFPIHQLIKICVRLEMARTTGKEFKKKMKLLEQEIEIFKEKLLENEEIANEYYFLINSGILKKEINEIEHLYYSSLTWAEIKKGKQKTIEELKDTYKRIKSRKQN